ncbi:MAG: GNAT family N-acetyltransferase [Mycolicibacterium sp.]|uniref:GNAT family N-acetyltransferase n=1 Tax=Mycolicibacterium sp. TaxID=2320850 RepID=UPI003D0DC992
MSTSSVLIPSKISHSAAGSARRVPRYSLLLCTDAASIEAAQRLRHDVFTSEPGFTLSATHTNGVAHGGLDADRFDQYCDHLLVRDDDTGEVVGCYRMLPPPGAIAAGGLYTATEFDVSALDPLRPSLVEMGRAVVRNDHRNGAVVLLMWAGILAYLDRSGYDFVAGCVSVPVLDPAGRGAAGSQLRGVRDFVLRRHRAPAQYTVRPYRPVVVAGCGLDEIAAPDRVSIPPLMRGYLRLGAQVCGEPAHDPDFGVGDFPALLDKRRADTRYLRRLRSVEAATAMAEEALS